MIGEFDLSLHSCWHRAPSLFLLTITFAITTYSDFGTESPNSRVRGLVESLYKYNHRDGCKLAAATPYGYLIQRRRNLIVTLAISVWVFLRWLTLLRLGVKGSVNSSYKFGAPLVALANTYS